MIIEQYINAEIFKEFLFEHKYTKALLTDENLYIGFTNNDNNIEDIDYIFWFGKEWKKNFYSYVAIAEQCATDFLEL